MLGENSNKMVYVAVAVGTVAALGTGASVMYPSAMDSVKSNVVHVAKLFVSNDSAEATADTSDLKNDINVGDDGNVYKKLSDGGLSIVALGAKYNNDSSITIPASTVISGKKYAVYDVNMFGASLDVDGKTTSQTSNINDTSSSDLNAEINGTKVPLYVNHNNDKKSLVISEGIKTVSSYGGGNVRTAYRPSHLSSLSLPNSLTSVGNSAFSYVNLNGDLTIPANVTTIGEHAFGSQSYVTSLKFADNSKLTSIGDYAFTYLGTNTTMSDKTITFPDKLKTIGEDAFEGHQTNMHYIFPKNLESLGDDSFLTFTNERDSSGSTIDITQAEYDANPEKYTDNTIYDMQGGSAKLGGIGFMKQPALYFRIQLLRGQQLGAQVSPINYSGPTQ